MLSEYPVIIFDKASYKELIDHIDLMKQKGTISSDDLKWCFFTDLIEGTIHHLGKYNFKV